MSTAELLLQDFDVEISNTRRTLERIPEDKPEWAPHDKSMKLGKLAMHCATLPLFAYYILEDDGMDIANSKRAHASLVFESREHCLQQLEKSPPQSVAPHCPPPVMSISPSRGPSPLANT